MTTGFHQRSSDALNQEKNQIEKQVAEWGVNADMLYLLPGVSMVRILPPYSEAGVFFRKITRHRVRTSSGNTNVLACPAAEGDFCALCAKAEELKETGDPVKMKFAKDNLKPQNRYLYNVLCYSAPSNKQGKTPEFGKVYVMEAGIMVHRMIISLDTDDAMGWADITNFNNGVNLIIKRVGQGLDTKYEVQPHGAGRSDLVAEFQARGLDISKLAPVNLDALYTPQDDKMAEIVGSLQVGSSPAVAPGSQWPAFNPQAVPANPVPAPPAGPIAAPVQAPAPVAPVQAPQAPQPVQPTVTGTPDPNVVQPTTSGGPPVATAPTTTGPVAPPQIPAPPANG